jgi:uncharacterized membrane protein
MTQILRKNRVIRPWLLVPKIVAFCIYVGGLSTVLGLWIVSDVGSMDIADPRRKFLLERIGTLLVFLVVPALLLTMLFGILLTIQTPQSLKMRWLRVKLVSLLIFIPASHFYCETRFGLLKHATDQATSASLARQLTVGFVISFAWIVWIIFLGRIKPRLGQAIVSSPSLAVPADS